MKKYTKYLAITLIVILSSFVLRSKIESSKAKVIEVPSIKEETPIAIERFSETETKVVQHKLDSLLQRIHKRNDFNGSLLVAKNGKILYENQIGYADFKTKQTLNEASLFQLASVSKQFTAAAIMLLYERDQLQLTETVTNFFPNFPYEGVTIQNLLNHTAGLPKYFWVAEHKWHQEKPPTNSEMMDLLADSKVQRHFKPGYNFDYSNTGYLVLASIVEKISGSSFGDFVEENIFEPLGMQNSFVYSYENDSIKSNQLEGYRLYKGWRHLKINNTINDAVVGDKNIYATTEDLLKWIIGLNNGKLISKESLEMMYAKGETVSGRKIPYGFGFRIMDEKDENTIYHYGKWNGFSTGLTQYPDDNLIIIVLEHTSYSGINALNKNVKKIVTENFQI